MSELRNHYKGKKCYIYTRVSTGMQVEGFSLDAQRERIFAYVKYQEMQVVGEYCDEGKSGKNIEGRPEFQKMLSDIKSDKDKVSFVLVFKLSRFGRNTADVLTSLQIMQDHGVQLICVDDSIDSSIDSGKLMISVLSAVAEIERDNILVQTMEGRRQKAREGKWNGGFAPYGYALQNGELKIAEDEVEVIRKIFDLYIHTTMGINGVAEWLNRQGYVKKKRQNNTKDIFCTHFVKDVLDNPVYCGKIAYGRRKSQKIEGTRNKYHIVKQKEFMLVQGIHEAIVSETDWDLAHQKRLTSGVKQIKTHSLEHEHILSGIVKCPICGTGMYGNVNRKKKDDGTYYKDYFYYACKHRRSINGARCDYKRQWSEEVINAAVEEFISKLVQNPLFAEAIKKKINSSVDTESLEKEIESLKKEHRNKGNAITRIGEEIDALDCSDRLYQRKYDDKQNRMTKLYDELSKIEQLIESLLIRLENIRQQRVTGENIYKLLQYFDKLYSKFTDLEKKQFMKSFVDRVDIYPDRTPEGQILKHIKFKFPVFFNGQMVEEFSWDKESHVETVVLLTR